MWTDRSDRVPREFVLVTGRPVTEERVRDAAASMRPALSARSVWSGGGLEVTDSDGDVVAMVLRSSFIEVSSAAEQVIGAAVAPHSLWTEAYGSDERPDARELLDRLAESVNGFVVELGVSE